MGENGARNGAYSAAIRAKKMMDRPESDRMSAKSQDFGENRDHPMGQMRARPGGDRMSAKSPDFWKKS